jgi:hypothetical protein
VFVTLTEAVRLRWRDTVEELSWRSETLNVV